MILRKQRGRGYRGLGFDYYDLLDQAGREVCDPKDSACVGRNQQRVNAVQDLWSQYLTDPNTANMSTPQIEIAVDTSKAATNAFMNNQPVEGSAYVYQGSTPTYVAPPAAATTTAATTTAAKTPAGSTVTTSSGVQNAPATTTTASTGASTTSSFALPDLPWYVWAGGAAAVLFMMRGR